MSNDAKDDRMRREHDSVDDFEHLEHENGEERRSQPRVEELIDISRSPEDEAPAKSELEEEDVKPVPATPPPSADFEKCQTIEQASNLFLRQEPMDSKAVTMAFVESERSFVEEEKRKEDFLGEIKSAVLPAPEKSPTIDFLGEEGKEERSRNIMDDDSWNVVEKPRKPEDEAPAKPLPPLPKEELESDRASNVDKYEMSRDFVEAARDKQSETGDSEFESEPEPSPAKSVRARQEPELPEERTYSCQRASKVEDIEIAPKEIFRDMGFDAWFNPERLNPKVAALIYWRDPKKSGIVFGGILGVLLSLAYFSLISVLAYISLLILTGTVTFRIYKTVLQAVQKTSDGHPFKDILEVDLTLPAEKVHEVADVAVAHANAAVGELRRLFLVEDFVDSVKFGTLLWCLTYVGSWFNGMTLIIIGVVALFTLPKVYETNKAQIDQNLALVEAKINELTAKVKAAIPLGKKAEPTKEE